MSISLDKPLLLSAAPFEVSATLHAFVQRHREFDYLPIGIGPFPPPRLDLIRHCQNRHVLFLGTAGVFSDFKEPFLVAATAAQWLPTCERFGLSYQAGTKLPNLQWEKSHLLQVLPEAFAYCSPNVSLKGASEFWTPSTNRLPVETIELYRVAAVVLPFVASFSVILGITNAVGESSHMEWKQNFQKCAESTAHFLNSHLF